MVKHKQSLKIEGLISIISLTLLLWIIAGAASAQGIKNVTVRGLADTIGFSFKADQIRKVIALSESLEAKELATNKSRFFPAPGTPWLAAICPHDDHLLAGRVYVHVFQNLAAKRVVIFGVAHKAWRWQIQNRLIFDDFDQWRAPMGPVAVSDVRDEIIKKLGKEDVIINNDFQSEEHSVEGIIPFLQFYRPEVEIVSILVPYMNWQQINRLSEHLSSALNTIIENNNWVIGKDIAFICSNDGDHYGDQDWDGKNLAPFGTDASGYLQATGRDSSLINTTLTGELTSEKIHQFCTNVWDEKDLKAYKITWCGRFSIPFGLETVRKLVEKSGHAKVNGILLRYDTSFHLGRLPLDPGIGLTAPFNSHHWVGYSALGYY